MRTLFVGGLREEWTSADLVAVFERFGSIREVRVMMHAESGRSRGFGFVTFADAAAAQRARLDLDGVEVDGQRFRVDLAR